MVSLENQLRLTILKLVYVKQKCWFLSIPFACSHFISSKAHCLAYQELLQTRYAQTSKSSKIRFGNFAKNLAKVFTPLTWIAQKINIIMYQQKIFRLQENFLIFKLKLGEK